MIIRAKIFVQQLQQEKPSNPASMHFISNNRGTSFIVNHYIIYTRLERKVLQGEKSNDDKWRTKREGYTGTLSFLKE